MPMIECPECGHKYYQRMRRKAGEGTDPELAPIKTLNSNHVQILELLSKIEKKITNRDLHETYLKEREYKAKKNRNWQYHDVQTNMSNLVGNGFVSSVTSSDEFYDHEESEFKTVPAPQYFVNYYQKIMFQRTSENDFEVPMDMFLKNVLSSYLAFLEIRPDAVYVVRYLEKNDWARIDQRMKDLGWSYRPDWRGWVNE